MLMLPLTLVTDTTEMGVLPSRRRFKDLQNQELKAIIRIEP